MLHDQFDLHSHEVSIRSVVSMASDEDSGDESFTRIAARQWKIISESIKVGLLYDRTYSVIRVFFTSICISLDCC